MQMDVPQAIGGEQASDLETLEIEIINKGSIRRAPLSTEAKPIGASVTMALDDWVETDRTMWELHNLVEIAIKQRDEANEALRALQIERELMGARLREWKTYARGLEKRLHTSQLRNVELTYAMRGIADVARQAILAPFFSGKLKDQLRDRFNQIANELG